MYCHKCGAQNQDKAQFCIKCGTRLLRLTPRGEDIGPPPARRGVLWIAGLIGAVVLLLMLMAFGLLLSGRLARGGKEVELTRQGAVALSSNVTATASRTATVRPSPTPSPTNNPTSTSTPAPPSVESASQVTPEQTPSVVAAPKPVSAGSAATRGAEGAADSIHLSPTQTLTESLDLPETTPGSISFQDDFADEGVFLAQWESLANGGSVVAGEGFLALSSQISNTFPYVRVRENPFPLVGDFILEVELEYTKVGDFGTGLVLGVEPPANGSPVQPQADPTVEHFKVWQDSSYHNALVVGTADTTITSLKVPDTDRHTVRFVYTAGEVQVYWDGVLAGRQPEVAPRPTTLWFGNPYRTPQIGSWSEFRIFSVDVHTSLPPATATSTPQPTPTVVACPAEPRGLFTNLWRTYQAQLGCPIQTEPLAGDFVEQPFEGGHMFWYAQIDLVIITMGGDQGDWTLYEEKWNEDAPPESCTMQVPAGRVQPVRGFGWIWCNDQTIRERLGWALDIERAFTPGIDLIEGFDNGIIFRDSDGNTRGKAYVLLGRDKGTFVRVPY